MVGEKIRILHFLRRYVCFVVVGLLFCVPGLPAQYIPSRPVTLIDHALGIRSPFNFFTHKDSRGLVWIGSSSDLYQYDGRQIKIYKPDPEEHPVLNPNHVHSFFSEDPKGNIWFGTWRGISCYIRDQDSFTSYTLRASNPFDRYMACGFDSLGKLWFIHDKRIYTLDTLAGVMNRMTDINTRLSNAEIQLDDAGRVKYVYGYSRYIINPGLSVFEFDSSGYCHYTSLCMDTGTDSVGVSDVQVVTDTSCLVATTRGLFMYNPEKNKIRAIQPVSISGDWVVHSITPYKDSLYLIGTAGQGYYVFDADENLFTERFHIRHKGEELLQAPLAMYTDADGAIWIHLDGQGVAFFHPRYQVFDFYPIEIEHKLQRISLYVHSLIEIDSQTVLATTRSEGAYFIHTTNGRIVEISACDHCPPDFRSAFKDSKGRIWLVSSKDLYLMERDGTVQLISRKKDVEFGFGFCELPDGRIINVSHGKLFISDRDEVNGISFSRLTEMDMHHNYSHIGVLPDGLFYATTTTKDSTQGIYMGVHDPENKFRKVLSIPASFGIRSIATIPDRVEYLAGTTHGLYILNISSSSCVPVTYAACGEQSIWKIFQIGGSQFFLCGEKSFSTIDLELEKSEPFGLEYGPGREGTSWFAYLKHSSGKIWIGQHEGISIVDPAQLAKPHFNANVHIYAIRINDRLEALNKYNTAMVLNPNEVRMVRLPPAMNTISFEFAALSYAGNNTTSFEYRMTGVEERWVDGGNQGFARYVNLAPGDYSFEVRVKNKPESVQSVGLYLVSPFYVRVWFLAILGICLLYIIYRVIKFSTLRKQRKVQLQFEKQLAIEQDRLRISNNLHDDLGSGLAALNLRALVIAQHTRDARTKSQVHQLAHDTRKLVGQISETIWAINPRHDTVDSLVTRLHQYTIEFFENTGIGCKVQLMPDQNLTRIPGEHRREIYLAFKEALHNVYKHARATEVRITMEMVDERQLFISVHDNGEGFDPTSTYNGQGIQSMRKRMHEIGGMFKLSSEPDGTHLQFTYTLH